MKVVLVAESGADIPKEIAEKEGIYIVPMHVTFDGETKDDGTFPASNIIDYFEKSLKIPKTSGSTIVDFDYKMFLLLPQQMSLDHLVAQ